MALTPSVSVIIPTYNIRPLLEVALDALRGQTLAADQLEVIVIDDGSTDDTWPFLEQTAARWPQLETVQAQHSGKPAIARNIGLRRATGRYVFFHDADDRMTPDALRRLVAAADRHGSDVVVGRTRITGGRHERSLIRPAARADLIKDKVWTTLSAQKLFRRAFLDRLGLEFCEDMVQGEDQVFVATALLAARRVSTLTDGDYYLRLRTRPGGGNLSDEPQTLQNKLLTSTRLTQLITDYVPDPRRRRRFMRRVILRVVAPALGRPFMNATESERAAALAELQRTALRELRPQHVEQASDEARLRLLVAARGTSADLVALNSWLGRRRSSDPPAAVRSLLSPDELAS